MKGPFVTTLVVLACVLALLSPATIATARADAAQPPGAYPHTTAKRVHRWGPLWVAAPPQRLAHPLPFGLDITALGAVGGCILVLAFWGGWQTSHRCSSCGYCPVFCRCDEVTSD